MPITTDDLSTTASLLQRFDHQGVTTLTMSAPERFNALSEAMLQALHDALAEIANDSSVRCVVLAAEGKAFCAGHDLKQMRANPDKAYYQALFARCSEVMQAIVHLPVPVIAKVQGIATAAGCQLVASCDLAVAERSARFAVSGINVGLFCSTPAVALSRNVARKHAMEMLLTGEFISADQAAEWGLINRVADDDALDEATEALATSICAKSAVAVRTGKTMFARQLSMPLDEAYAFAGETMACNMLAEDVGEGIDAFIAKRLPRWNHR
ncbi:MULTISPECIES: enoyl-CoA hydratase [Halomonadaceae]|uniref:enoyl-CoA hydratase n=1 Tax=Halomonadaceae TaxID=28256 RepID=UPI00114217F2|nr:MULTISPECIES: enoyl-CoA hydratase [Halomonas]UEQ03955.1 enoyl-CoA hydratase [Halomonas profundus]CAD5263294.1 Crotonase, core [Halomonas sp. 113]CAD5265280.1 Crotonase, core [Halomonas sp. 59]CAD5278093.1 Enoyl-CoA hydratase [Halomonas sp. I3]CAD5284900.1 Crotonase, core [Halomonas sp. 156]